MRRCFSKGPSKASKEGAGLSVQHPELEASSNAGAHVTTGFERLSDPDVTCFLAVHEDKARSAGQKMRLTTRSSVLNSQS